MNLSEQVGRADTKKLLILVVDDEPSISVILEHMLRSRSVKVISASSVGEAHKRIASSRPDLILLDLMLPDESGLSFCRTIKTDRTTRDIPVIILSVRASDQDKIAGLDVGADDYVTKPFKSGELKARIHSVIRSYAERTARRIA